MNLNFFSSPSREKTVAESLPYFSLDTNKESLLWMKDGGASATLALTPKSVMSSPDEDLEALRSGLTMVLNQVPEGTLLQFLMRREATNQASDLAVAQWTKAHTPEIPAPSDDPLQKLKQAKQEAMETLWKDNELFQTRIYVTVRVSSEIKAKPLTKIGPLSHLGLIKTKSGFKSSQVVASEARDLLNSLKIALESQGFEARIVTASEILKTAYEFLNPEREFPKNSFQVATDSDLSESLSQTDLIETRRGLQLGRTSLRIGTMKTLPDSSTPGLMAHFSMLPLDFWLVQTILVLPQTSERERLSRRQRLTSGLVSGNNVRNLSAETQLTDIEDTLTAMIGSGEKLLASSFHLIAFEKESAEAHTFTRLLEEGEKLGPGCRWFEETVGAFPVFFGILPFAPSFITRPKRVLSSNLCDFLPVFGIGSGHNEAAVLFETPYQSALGLSLYEKSPSANGILIGSTGSGKSTLACGLILGMSAGGHPAAPSNFVIDVGNSFKRTIQYLGGSSLDLSPEKGTIINPFDLEPGDTRPSPEKIKFLTALFDEILGDAGNLTKLERALLETEILVFYEKKSTCTLSLFREHLEASDSVELRRLSKLLTLWCRPHPYGLLFDGTTNVNLKAPHLHFELRGCQRYPDLLRAAMLVVMNAIWGEVKARFPHRSIICVDEAHTMIRTSGDGRANTSARVIEDYFRQIRKFSGGVLALSQTAKDLKNDDIGDGILANAPNRFILRQRGDEKTLREDLKLNERELADVFSLSQVRGLYSEFFLHSEFIKSILIYRPTSLELWLSTTHPPDNALLEKEWAMHPEWSLVQIMDHMAGQYPQGAPEDQGGAAA